MTTTQDDTDLDNDGTEAPEEVQSPLEARVKHEEYAEFVNAHSGLDPVTPQQVRAVLDFRSDFHNSPEQTAKREERKAIRDARAAKFAGLTPEQKEALKTAERKVEQAKRLAAKAAAAQADADQLLASARVK